MCRNDESPQFIKELDAAPNVCLDDPYDGPEQEYHRDPRGSESRASKGSTRRNAHFIVTSHELLNLKVYWILEGPPSRTNPPIAWPYSDLPGSADRLNPVLDKYFPSTSPREPDQRP